MPDDNEPLTDELTDMPFEEEEAMAMDDSDEMFTEEAAPADMEFAEEETLLDEDSEEGEFDFGEEDEKPAGPVRYRKPRFDGYTMLLFLALVALGLGITCFYFEMEYYDWEYEIDTTTPGMPLPETSAMAPVPAKLLNHVPFNPLEQAAPDDFLC